MVGLHEEEKRPRRTACVFGHFSAMYRWEQLDAEPGAVKGLFA